MSVERPAGVHVRPSCAPGLLASLDQEQSKARQRVRGKRAGARAVPKPSQAIGVGRGGPTIPGERKDGWSKLGEAPVQPAKKDDDSLEDCHRATLRSRCTDAGETVKSINGPFGSGRSQDYYASCRSCTKDPRCPVHYLGTVSATATGETMTVLKAGSHTGIPAVVRRDAAHPLPSTAAAAVRAKIQRIGPHRAVAYDVAEEVGDDLGMAVPGQAVQNILKNARRLWRGARGRRAGSVQGLQAWSVAREVRVDVEEVQWPSDPESLTVFALGEEPNKLLPLTSDDWVSVAFGVPKFVRHIFDVAPAQAATTGFVGQGDFLYKVVWQGYALALSVSSCTGFFAGEEPNTFAPLPFYCRRSMRTKMHTDSCSK